MLCFFGEVESYQFQLVVSGPVVWIPKKDFSWWKGLLQIGIPDEPNHEPKPPFVSIKADKLTMLTFAS